MRLIHVIIYMALALTAQAQVQVSGRVVDEHNKPVADVIVRIVSEEKTVAFTTTNSQGAYIVELKESPKGEVKMLFSHISYEREEVNIEVKEKSMRQDMVMCAKSVSLKEVQVRAKPLWQKGDTLSHILAAFLGKGDVTLEDGLKRLPGVEVSKMGTISYMGKPISQFNIEGMDLLGGKYNLATRNIPADYVSNVEIVRNHHSRKVDRDKPSDEVSMNIKLAKKAKFKPFGQEEAGAGYMQEGRDELQALLGVTGMMFTDTFQTICSLKGGNYKNYAKADMYDHFGSSDIRTSATGLFGGFDGGSPPQGEYLYQRNGMVTLNAISKLDSVTTAKVNADYSYNRATHDISQSTTYLSGGEDYMTVSESVSPLSTVHLPKLSMNYMKNADNVYLSNDFNVKGKFESNEGDVHFSSNGAESTAEQRRRTSSFEVADRFWFTRRNEKGTQRHINGAVSYKRTPTLNMNFSHDGEEYAQTAQSSTLAIDASTSVDVLFGKSFRINLPLRVSATYDELETNRVHTGDVNDICGWAFTPSVSPGFEVRTKDKRLYARVSLSAMLKGLYYNKLNYTKPVLNPSLNMNYTFNANSKLSFHSAYNTTIGDMMTLLTSPMQVDYRSVRTSSGIIGESNSWNTGGDWKWQLPLQYFTLSIGASHSEGKRNTLTSQSINGIDVSSSALLRDTRSRSTNFNISSSKNLPALYAKFSVEGNYGFGDGEQAVNERIIKTQSSNYNMRGSVDVTPISWLELSYDIRYGWSQSKYAEAKNTVTSLTHSGAIHVFPISALDISVNYDHVRRQISEGQYKNMALFNASAQYKMKQTTLRLELTNLLNQRHYSYTVFDGINTYCYDYGLCGRTVMTKVTFKL
ncbi:MAG: TonB-dependent receptor [Prevotellaceae bacterium]|nr:TonB-dependent receptor [Prevotellaceae bacterium]